MKRTVIVMIALFAGAVSGSLLAQSSPATTETFSWHGELVALDENAKILTVKVPVVGDQAQADFGKFKAAEKLMVTWSGLDKYADAIKHAVRLTEATKTVDRFTFPIEFVSYDSSRRYVTFKVQVPDASVTRLKSIKPGEWVTATSPHGPSSKNHPIVMIRHYNDPATSPNSN